MEAHRREKRVMPNPEKPGKDAPAREPDGAEPRKAGWRRWVRADVDEAAPEFRAQGCDGRVTAAPVAPSRPARTDMWRHRCSDVISRWVLLMCIPGHSSPVREIHAHEEGPRHGARRGDVRDAADGSDSGTRRRPRHGHEIDTRCGVLDVEPMPAPVPPLPHLLRSLDHVLLGRRRTCGLLLAPVGRLEPRRLERARVTRPHRLITAKAGSTPCRPTWPKGTVLTDLAERGVRRLSRRPSNTPASHCGAGSQGVFQRPM